MGQHCRRPALTRREEWAFQAATFEHFLTKLRKESAWSCKPSSHAMHNALAMSALHVHCECKLGFQFFWRPGYAWFIANSSWNPINKLTNLVSANCIRAVDSNQYRIGRCPKRLSMPIAHLSAARSRVGSSSRAAVMGGGAPAGATCMVVAGNLRKRFKMFARGSIIPRWQDLRALMKVLTSDRKLVWKERGHTHRDERGLVIDEQVRDTIVTRADTCPARSRNVYRGE